jgi:hypothetical protein
MTFLLYSIFIPLLIVASLLGIRFFSLEKKKKEYPRGGLHEFYSNSQELYIYSIRVLSHFLKVAKQYIFHLFVRFLYQFQNFTNRLYAQARGKFFQTVVRDKKSVSRFWEHLKEYKQEIDNEKKK